MSHVAASPVASSSVSSKNAPWAVFKRAIPGVFAWVIALLLFFPIFWMTITAFKTEQQAYASSLFFMPTLDSFREVFARSNYFSCVCCSPCRALMRWRFSRPAAPRVCCCGCCRPR
jgi:sorbitol/mannitol transport system permease protein